MSHGINACVLIRLDGRANQWVPLTDLSAHMALPVELIAEHCAALQAIHLISVQRSGADGAITHARASRSEA